MQSPKDIASFGPGISDPAVFHASVHKRSGRPAASIKAGAASPRGERPTEVCVTDPAMMRRIGEWWLAVAAWAERSR